MQVIMHASHQHAVISDTEFLNSMQDNFPDLMMTSEGQPYAENDILVVDCRDVGWDPSESLSFGNRADDDVARASTALLREAAIPPSHAATKAEGAARRRRWLPRE